MVFKKGGQLSKKDAWYYRRQALDEVSKFTYLRIVFSTGWSFSHCQATLSGQAQYAISKLFKGFQRYVGLSPKFI